MTSSVELKGLAEDIFTLKYAYPGERKWSERAKTIARHVATVEPDDKKAVTEAKFYDSIRVMDFIPGGRIIFGAGRNNYNLLNCYVLEPADTVESIGKTVSDMYKISCGGGGVGFNFSKIRPKGDDIQNIKNSAPGSVSVMRMINEIGEHVRAGKNRRTALIGILDIRHPDILEFLKVKLEHGELENFNISIGITNRFIEAVDNDEDWYFLFNGKKYHRYVCYALDGTEQVMIGVSSDDALGRANNHKVTPSNFTKTEDYPLKAKELWDYIFKFSVESGDPGIYNVDLANTYTNTGYFETLPATNPCITGDTLIATADGRNAVTIKQLSDEKDDVPVYSYNIETKRTEIKLGRKPRLTGKKKGVWRLTLDDGSYLKATGDHKILTKNDGYVELQNLRKGTSIVPWNSFNSNGYRQITNVGAKLSGGARRNRRQYRLIAEYHNLNVDPKKYAIHHRNFCKTDDFIDNLQAMTHVSHRDLHSKKMLGKKNPYHKMSDEWKFNFASHPGSSNPNWINISNQKLIEFGKTLLNKEGKITKKLWITFAKKNNLPQSLSSKSRFGSFSSFKSLVINNHKVKLIEFLGYEDTYNITVDDNHNYFIISSHEDKKFIKSSGICVKNCGEIPLPAYGNCCLGHVNLSNMVDNGGIIDWKRLARTIRTGVRFLDNVLTANTFPIPECKEVGTRSRRIGLGITGLHYFLLKAGYKYGDERCLEFLDRLFSTIRDEAYKASISIAKEKGSFDAFDSKLYLKQEFAKTLPPRIRTDIKKHGIRNAVMLTIAPCGTISMIASVSTGIEPIFSPAYKRRYRENSSWKEAVVLDPLYEQFFLEGRSLEHFCGAYDVTPEEHIKVQATIQRYIDSAISKTINLPENYDYKKLTEVILDYAPYIKGCTIYRAGSKGQEPLEVIKIENETELMDLIKRKKSPEIEVEDMTCKTGSCEL